MVDLIFDRLNSVVNEFFKDNLLSYDNANVELKPLMEFISVEAQNLVNLDKGPGLLVEALVKRGLNDFAALAAECHYRASLEKQICNIVKASAENSPVLMVAPRELLAVPGGLMDGDAILSFEDRVFKVILKNRIKKITIVLSGLKIEADLKQIWLDRFLMELNALKIKVVLKD